MRRFAALLDDLSYQSQRNAKLKLLERYFAEAPDPDRGYALAALTGGLALRRAKPAVVRELVDRRVDPVLFALSYDYVGDLAETAALIWPAAAGASEPPSLAATIQMLEQTGRARLPEVLESLMDSLDVNARWALVKLITGGLRVGVSARLAKMALASFGGVAVTDIEELWHALAPPYATLFAWLEGRGDKPTAGLAGAYRPVMLAHPLDEAELAALDPGEFRAEWKWDGARVQVAGDGARIRLYSRSGDDISGGFPEVVGQDAFNATLDGELLVLRDGVVQPFAELQRRLNRKRVSARQVAERPCIVRLYDILLKDGDDLRAEPFTVRRRQLEEFHRETDRPSFDLSVLVPFDDWPGLAVRRAAPGEPGVEGLMLKRAASPYLAGRVRGHWFKWKRDPYLIDAVLMYAQRGHGKRSSYYSDYTFGVWRADELVPVGKAYFGFTDAELAELDRWVRHHTVNRFGPVREVDRGLVLEVAFEGVQRSNRHKAGVAMRFPRINRIRWDKPADEADTLDAVTELLAP